MIKHTITYEGVKYMQPIIKVNNLVKTYKKRRAKGTITAVDHISFTVNRGEILGLLGPNGAGKTSTIKMICGLLKPDSGTITINNIDSQQKRLDTLKYISAVLEGNRNLYWRLTVKENLEYFAGNRGFSRKDKQSSIEKLLKQFHLKSKEKELVNRLSRGMQQKLAIAVAMLADTDVILLDEPTLGLDVETGYEVREILKDIVSKEQRTIIISSHDMSVIQDICDRTVIVNHGKVITNDRVENLMKLFSVRAYEIVLAGFLSKEQQSLLRKKFPMLTYLTDTHESIIQADLAKSSDIYDLFDILKMEKIDVESIDRGTINFEQIFIKILKGENADALG